MTVATANLVETSTCLLQCPAATINNILVVIAALYELLGFDPTKDPLIGRLC